MKVIASSSLLLYHSTGWKAVYEPEDKDDEEEKGEDSIVKKVSELTYHRFRR